MKSIKTNITFVAYLTELLCIVIIHLHADFTIVIIPDTQFYSQNPNPNRFDTQTRWIIDHKDSLNIVFVSHMGDLVQVANDTNEWERASNSMAILDGKVPYGISPGNHDLDDGLQTGAPGKADLFRRYFPVSRFDQEPWWGGYYSETDNTRNSSYQLISVDSLDFIIINLEWEAPDDVLHWASTQLDNFSERRALVNTHYYLNPTTGQRDTNWPYPRAEPNYGEDIWNELIRFHANVFMVNNGHWGPKARLTSYNDSSNPVFEIVQDYSERSNGGDGWLRYYTFRPSENKIYAYTYSPTLDLYEIDTSSQFVLDYIMDNTVGSFTQGGIDVESSPGLFLRQRQMTQQIGIRYRLSTDSFVRLHIYSIQGLLIKTILNGRQSFGKHHEIWDGKDNRGNKMANGAYIARLQINSEAFHRVFLNRW